MGLKRIAAMLLAKREMGKVDRWAKRPAEAQERTFAHLLRNLNRTAYGKQLGSHRILNRTQWAQIVPLTDYEDLRPWVDRVKSGERDVLWPGLPDYFCKTSGTTSGTKYIPMTKGGLKAQVRAARTMLLAYIHQSGDASFVDGKMIFLQGSPVLHFENGIAIGRLSGIVAHHVPAYLQRNRLPSWDVNCMDDWEQKVEAIAQETAQEDMRLISGIPPWVQMYFERLLVQTGKKTVKEVFPNLRLFLYGGVNFEPYRPIMTRLLGGEVAFIESYPASEGFIAFGDSSGEEGMLLNLDAGIFYEFIELSALQQKTPQRLQLEEVQMDTNYAIVLNTDSGLWGYVIGDTVRFTSLQPYRVIVTGRIKHFISAFGEHVIAEEVERSMALALAELNASVVEFHVAPQVAPSEGLPYHEWLIEAESELPPALEKVLDLRMCEQNTYYRDLIEGKVLQPLKVRQVPLGSFRNYMKQSGKLGGQNKLPRLSNDRSIADSIPLV